MHLCFLAPVKREAGVFKPAAVEQEAPGQTAIKAWNKIQTNKCMFVFSISDIVLENPDRH